MLMRRLRVTIGLLAMRVSRSGMHFRLGVLVLFMVVRRFPVVVRGRFVFCCRRVMMSARCVFGGCRHSKVSLKTSVTFRGEAPVVPPSRTARTASQHESGVRWRHNHKKTDAIERPKAIHHAGLLVNKPPGLGRAAPYLVIR
jgi:hypothetical protein